MHICEFKAYLVYRASSMTTEKPISNKQKKHKEKKRNREGLSGGGICLYSQHLGSRGRQISEFEAENVINFYSYRLVSPLNSKQSLVIFLS